MEGDLKKSAPSVNRTITFFVVCFLSLVIVFMYGYQKVENGKLLQDYLRLVAGSVGAVLTLAGFRPAIDGTLVSVKGFSMIVVPACSAIPPMSIFVASIIAFPSSIKKKSIGVAVGLPVLFGINTLRLVALALLGAYSPGFFQFAHLYLWQTFYIIFVVLLWLAWIAKVVKR